MNALDFAKGLLEMLKPRSTHLADTLIADPSWFILLDLYVRRIEERPITVSAVCTGSGAPSTTALRHLQQLVQDGHVVRENARHDRRVVYVMLSPSMADTMTTVLKQGLAGFAKVLRLRKS